ncbi:CRP-like cAMP-binding protein [Streptomyces sp. 1114.5]|uniref:Crp/Fnr family transcriptional regulator n=1 Tax=unclassified Streptomyces TaxID=2593676 RepID=UPI000BC3FC08|nr:MULTISPECIES: Crp/Fnr family transcriptional regulator [unclassified Streptomyces]RKT17552.1 CRP-like cAMP-binding protein [Streptomyces sp. 1114.5]SOB83761.1 cAMP-binding domain of CRP or a regulatory subunit of cAMP-dependent protein kinases [Streptomyces sp. 1331.2]
MRPAGPASGGRIPFWRLLDAPARAELTAVARRVRYPAGAALLQQHEHSDHLLVIERGCVKVLVESGAGYRAILAIRGDGDLLGEQAGLDGGARSATLHALTEVTALHIPLSRFGAVQHANPAVAQALQQVLSGRLRDADQQRAATGSAVVRPRLAALLLELAERYGDPAPTGEVRISLPLSQDDLAGLVLSSRRTVNRLLEEWRDAGWLRTGRREIELLHPAELEKLARAEGRLPP